MSKNAWQICERKMPVIFKEIYIYILTWCSLWEVIEHL